MPLPVDNNLLPIGKAASLLKVSADTLRRLEKKGRIIPHRGPNGERLFSADDITLLSQLIRKPVSERVYSIQEAANILKVSSQTLRRWEREGKISPNRTAGGQRFYTVKDIQTLQNVSKIPSKPISQPMPFPMPVTETAVPPIQTPSLPQQPYIQTVTPP